ncbi:hypothetical protein SAMD00019534_122440, partial [Acytostelium subglobosum LB1]|uniref:hypothetical protein n=1 Tax=Acytostelium subglobosum LB1 TaxID=1410327 RepID=UPI000644B281
TIMMVMIVLSILSVSVSAAVTPSVKIGEDWSLPTWLTSVAPNSGFFSEEADHTYNVDLPVFDIAWNQINPARGVYVYNISATIQGMPINSFATQNSTLKGPFWMRLWTSSELWAPSWIKSYCNVGVIGVDDDQQGHLPIWDACVWGEIKEVYKHLYYTLNMRADPRLKFVDVSDDYSYKLVYTGEDYPFDVDNWPEDKNNLARDAINMGMGVRNGITEVFNFHLSNIPSFGYIVDSTGYIVENKSWPLLTNPNRVVAAENECYTDCQYKVPANLLFYAIKMSNLKAIQMGVNWLYVVPSQSRMGVYPEHWNWVRYSIGRSPSNAFEAWAQLRTAQDTFDSSYNFNWDGKPYVKNFERYLTQRDVVGGAYTVAKLNKFSQVVDPTNGISYEGRQTQLANGNNSIAFFVDDRFVATTEGISVDVKVTYNDVTATSWLLTYVNGDGVLTNTSAVVTSGTSKNLTTATFNLGSVRFDGSLLPGNCDLKLSVTGANDVDVWFVRVIKTTAVVPSTTSTTTTTTTSPTTSTTSSTTSTTSSQSTTSTTTSPTTSTTSSTTSTTTQSSTTTSGPSSASALPIALLLPMILALIISVIL